MQGYFNENNICKDCKEFVDPECIKCEERSACLQCLPGYYPIDKKCHPCKERFGEFCNECTSGGCLKCQTGLDPDTGVMREGYFVSYGECKRCSFIEGCLSDRCGEKGCDECKRGYYLDEGDCTPCSKEISGCNECRSADLCTKCASTYLRIDDGICKCREGMPHQITDSLTGACYCEEGYYMTTRGCQTCEYLIPGCTSCNSTDINTGITLYSKASMTNDLKFLTCNRCKPAFYVKSGSIEEPIACKHC